MKIKKFRYFILILLISSISTPLTAFAGPLDSIGKFVSCSGANFISSYITSKLTELAKLIPKFRIPGIPGLGPVPVEDIVFNPRYQSKEYVQDIIARCAAREILTKMNQNILNVVRTAGRDGGVSFIKNWRNFILGSQYRGEDIWRGILYVAAYGDSNLQVPPLLCDHIRNSPAFRSLLPRQVDNLIQSRIQRRVGTLEEYLTAAKCDSFVNKNYETFLRDFAAGGGWDMLEKLAQPQNNVFGAINLAMDELERQRKIEEKTDINEALAGGGFTSIRGTSTRGSSCIVAGIGGSCIIYKDIKTPGSIILGGVNATTEQELAYIANADELNEVIASALEVLFNRMADLGNPNEGDYKIPGPVEFDPNSLPSPEPFPTEEPIPPEEEPNPSPTSPPTGGQLASLLADVTAERNRYGQTISGIEAGTILNAVAWNNRSAGWGLSGKNFGAFCPSPAGDIACDILHYQPTNTIVDVFGSGPGGVNDQQPANPQWNVLGPPPGSNRPWVAPVQP